MKKEAKGGKRKRICEDNEIVVDIRKKKQKIESGERDVSLLNASSSLTPHSSVTVSTIAQNLEKLTPQEIFSFVHEKFCLDCGDTISGLIFLERSSDSYCCCDCIWDRIKNNDDDFFLGSDFVLSQDSIRIFGNISDPSEFNKEEMGKRKSFIKKLKNESNFEKKCFGTYINKRKSQNKDRWNIAKNELFNLNEIEEIFNRLKNSGKYECKWEVGKSFHVKLINCEHFHNKEKLSLAENRRKQVLRVIKSQNFEGNVLWIWSMAE